MQKPGTTAKLGIALLIIGVSALFFCHRAGYQSSWDGSEGYGTVIGIDLGNTYSRVAVQQGGTTKVLADEYGESAIHSSVTFTGKEHVVGNDFNTQDVHHPGSTLGFRTEFLGSDWSDRTVQKLAQDLPYKVVHEGQDIVLKVAVEGQEKSFSAEQISGMILSKLKSIAEGYLDEKVTHAVVTVPVSFTDAQRQAVKSAGDRVGLKVLRIVNDATAAAIAYDLNRDGDEENIIVFDLGGTTLKVALLNVDAGVFEIWASDSANIGGSDFNKPVVDYLVKQFNRKYNIDISSDRQALGRVRAEVEKAKVALSFTRSTRIDVSALSQGIDFSWTLTRAKFEELNSDLFSKLLNPLKRVMNDAKVNISDIHHIVLTGGASRIPKVITTVEEYFKGKVLSKGLGDEAIVIGAANQGAILSGLDTIDVGCCIDIQPVSLGFEVAGGIMRKLVIRNTLIPTRKSLVVSTAIDSQDTMQIRVFAGERAFTKDNLYLGSVDLDEVAPAAAGDPRIQISFEVDPNRTLTVVATNTATGQAENYFITGSFGANFKDEEVGKFVIDAEMNAEADKAILERHLSKLDLESYHLALKLWISNSEERASMGNGETKTLVDALQHSLDWLHKHSDGATKNDFDQQAAQLWSVTRPIIGEISYEQVLRVASIDKSIQHDEL